MLNGNEGHFWAKVKKTEHCWLWTGCIKSNGYGTYGKEGKYAHRISYVLTRGEIPLGLQLDHLCRVRNCVNPDHLEAVTRKENIRRGMAGSGINSRKTSCIRGHKLSGSNLLVVGKRKKRQCKICSRFRFLKFIKGGSFAEVFLSSETRKAQSK